MYTLLLFIIITIIISITIFFHLHAEMSRYKHIFILQKTLCLVRSQNRVLHEHFYNYKHGKINTM
jgi:hypothetical protein